MVSEKEARMKTALLKEFFRTLRLTINRFFAIAIMVGLGVAFFAGLRATQPDMELSVNRWYEESNFYDLWIKSDRGITNEEVNEIKEQKDVLQTDEGYSDQMYALIEDNRSVTRVYSMPSNVNQLKIKEGRLPKTSQECFADSKLMEQSDLKIGDWVEFETGENALMQSIKNQKYKIVGFGDTPLYLTADRGSSTIGNGKVDYFFFLPKEDFSSPVMTDVYVQLKGLDKEAIYQSGYDDKIKASATEMKKMLKEMKLQTSGEEEKNWYVLSRKENASYVEYGSDAERIGAIGKVFPIIFFLVAALVALTTMTRMVEEERNQIGTLKAMGYSSFSISAKYFWYALLASGLGSLLGLLAGQKVLPTIIMSAYKTLYQYLPHMLTPVSIWFSLYAVLAAIACTTLATAVACYKELLMMPAELMRPQSPKPGKRVLLERVGFIWKRLDFTGKATIRNLFRYKKRLFMTLFGIAGSTALLLVGFGVRDAILKVKTTQYTEIIKYDAEVAVDEEKNLDWEVEKALGEDDRITEWLAVQKSNVVVFANGEKQEISLIVPKNLSKFGNYIALRERRNGKKIQLSENGIVITEKLARLLDVKKGDSLKIQEGDLLSKKVMVDGITENYFLNYVYSSKEYYAKAMKTEPVFMDFWIHLKDQSESSRDQFGSDYLKYSSVQGVEFTQKANEKIADMLKTMDGVIWVLVASAGLLALVVLYNLNNINVTERKRELSTLKVLGFFDREVSAYLLRENVILTLMGILLGYVFGFLLTRFVVSTAEVDVLMFGRQIRLISYLFSGFITFFFTACVNIIMHFSLKRIHMLESLKSVE